MHYATFSARALGILALAAFAAGTGCKESVYDDDRDGFFTAGEEATPLDDCDDADPFVYPGALERCDLVDNDCDGEVDEEVTFTAWPDADGDGHGDPDLPEEVCELPEGYAEVGDDCDDDDPMVVPGGDEYCDEGVDNDCDGRVDEPDAVDAVPWYRDADEDGFGDPEVMLVGCVPEEGYVADDTDCDDANPDANPGADEHCNGFDDDCDGATDEPDAVDAPTWYIDYDGDGYGAADYDIVSCVAPPGYDDDNLDCDDVRPDANPDADEVCNEADDDCDGDVDEPDAVDAATWYADSDADGYGDPDSTTPGCTQPSGYAAEGTDCDDADAAVSPAADESCNAVDDDCDGDVDEDDAVDALTWYLDGDADGYGLDDDTTLACDQPSGYAADSGDCDDGDDAVSPGADEVCNNFVDDDCDDTDNDCPVSGSLTPSDADAALTGLADGDGAGTAAALGDFDGDGAADVLVGGGEGAWLVLGAPASGDLGLADLRLVSEGTGDRVGAGVAAGDLDADGLADLLVGAPGHDSGGNAAGAVYLVNGGTTSGRLELSDADAILYGEGDGHLAGTSVAAAGDVDGDGTGDLLVGAPGYEDTGAAYLLHGPVLGLLDLFNADAVLQGGADGDGAGWSVSAAGDLDGDGIDDLATGAPLAASEAGAAYAVLGPVVAGQVLSTDADWILAGVDADDQLGWAVCGPGDLDGDGYDDLVVGVPGEDSGGTDAGGAAIFLGPTPGTAADALLTGEAAGDAAGTSVAAAGDLDQDGSPDLVVGAPGADGGGTDAGAAYLVYGPISATLSLSSADAVLDGGADGDEAGSALAGGDDADGDGYPDLVVGASGESTAGAAAGAAWVILGGGL